jgi:tetratricopeptide (TPR) repeat protein
VGIDLGSTSLPVSRLVSRLMSFRHRWLSGLLILLFAGPSFAEESVYEAGLRIAERTLEGGNLERAYQQIERLLERDKRSIPAWTLRSSWALKADLRDEQVYAEHQILRLSILQGVPKGEVKTLREGLLELDPIAKDLFAMKSEFMAKLLPVGEQYEKQDRPHSAIRVYKQILALDPENAMALAAIERIAASPDPSLAGDAKPKDLFEDVTEEWIREHDDEHGTWDSRAKLERENYITYTDAGYEVLLRTAEAMEQLNAFYRIFFMYGTEEHGGSVPRIGLNIFKNRDEYLEKGIGPPVEWSGGHFTGSFVETYIPASGGFEGMVGTLFHEAAHQFVSLATQAVGWLNEGLASFFEGTRILPNGTVIMNMPATGRLMPLARRMGNGWMKDHKDGIGEEDPNQTPETAPTFRIVLENKYSWGPAWYAPTWGVVYFLYNYQDPVDGRFIYRRAFGEFINKSGGRMGDGAVRNFEEVVLGNPMPPLKIDRPEDAIDVRLPKTVEELDEVWLEYCLNLRDELNGTLEFTRPYYQWGQYAVQNKLFVEAKEHFEKGLVNSPDDIELLLAFSDLLSGELNNPDRATKLVLEALHFMERQDPVDEKGVARVEKLLGKLDKKQKSLNKVRGELATAARAVVARYQAAGLDTMVMDVSLRMAKQLDLSDLYVEFEGAVRRSGKSLAIWDLAYNERNLEGWTAQADDGAFDPNGIFLNVEYERFQPGVYDYQFLTLDRLTSGDFSMEANILVERGKVAFSGFVFGQKDSSTFHGLLYMPGLVEGKEGTANSDYVDLMSSFGGGLPQTWRHVPVKKVEQKSETVGEVWHKLRLDVSGAVVDFYVDGEFLSTHEFSSRDVLRGRFGLITGKGACRYRDVRYLAREPADQSAEIERQIRFEEMRKEGGGAVGGSYLGMVPPFPRVTEWVQGNRESWDELGPVPQLVMFISIVQNDIVPVDGWLRALEKKMRPTGFAITIVTSPNDRDRIVDYMKTHGLPGDVAVDYREEFVEGIGESFETFFIDRFNLPRALLLDVDQKVIWEGDPGAILGSGLAPGFETFLDAPIQELVKKRRLNDIAAWIADWEERGIPLLHDGEFLAAIKLLDAAQEFESGLFEDIDFALAQGAAVRAAVEALESTANSIQRSGAEASFGVLLEWAAGLDVKPSKKELKDLKKVLDGSNAKGWDNAVKALGRFDKRSKLPFEERRAQLLTDLEGYPGTLVSILLADLKGASEDSESFEALAASAESRPRLWLARDYFGW